VAYLIPRSVLVLVNTTQAPAKLTGDQGNVTEESLQLYWLVSHSLPQR
jgi:hypothetical protein